DTTGAGDAFCGALAVSLARGEPYVRAVLFATMVATLSVTKMGASASMPTLAAVHAFEKLLVSD
ncbi:MAG: ribokinase, partial [Chloroflexi bacterium]|nr:ribokinase [Chloroflexota bacterium]